MTLVAVLAGRAIWRRWQTESAAFALGRRAQAFLREHQEAKSIGRIPRRHFRPGTRLGYVYVLTSATKSGVRIGSAADVEERVRELRRTGDCGVGDWMVAWRSELLPEPDLIEGWTHAALEHTRAVGDPSVPFYNLSASEVGKIVGAMVTLRFLGKPG